MAFADVVKADAVAVFANPDEFGESLSYTPDGGPAATVRCVVDRKPAERHASRDFKSSDLVLSVPNDATDGVTTVAPGKDTVAVAPILGGSTKTYRVIEILNQDPGMWEILCRSSG